MVTTAWHPMMRWFAPPVLATVDTTRRARALWMIGWSFLALLAFLLAAAIIATPETLVRRGTSIALVGLLVLFLNVLNRRGHTRLASWMFVLGLTVILTQRAWFTGGVHAPVAFFYMLFVLIASGLLGARGAAVTAIACLGSAMLLTIAELRGWLTPPAAAGSTAVAFIAVLLAISMTLAVLKLLLRQAEQLATDDLVNMFVHDMRSPLTVIRARLGMLKDEVDPKSESAEHVDAAMADALVLNRMANNLLDIRRLESARLPLQRTATDIAPLARQVVHALGTLDPTRHMEVRARMPVVCRCDPELMRRIIENLVSNAVKHTPLGGKVVVEIASTPSCVTLSVQDEGPGVPRESRAQIFEHYSATALRTQSGYHSVGLGLAFCKLAVEAHDGKIWVEDVPSGGSRFVVELSNI
jgi:signal transduction histidine kinase